MTAPWSGVIRAATQADLPFLQEMALLAFYSGPHETPPPLAKAMRNPMFAAWFTDWDWGRDAAFIAFDGGDAPVGAAWYRFFSYTNHTYVFLHDNMPELGIAVHKVMRGLGVGTALMRALLDHARAAGVERMTLNADAANPALRLYERAGFRTAGVIMLADLRGDAG